MIRLVLDSMWATKAEQSMIFVYIYVEFAYIYVELAYIYVEFVYIYVEFAYIYVEFAYSYVEFAYSYVDWVKQKIDKLMNAMFGVVLIELIWLIDYISIASK